MTPNSAKGAAVSAAQEAGLRGQLRRLRLFPGHTLSVRLKIASALHSRRTKRAAQEMRERGLEQLLAGKDPEAMDQDPADLMFLYRRISTGQVARAIEFGSGQSTLFIAQAMHDKGQGHLHSLDADERWLEHTSKILPGHLRPYVTFVHSPVVINREYGPPAWEYSVVPDGKWDFVLIDGPSLTEEVKLSCDLIKLVPALADHATGMIDHRWRTAVLAREVAGAQLRIRFAPSLESFLFQKRAV